MISAHGIGEKLECPLCPKKLMTPNNLSGHLKTVHARESVTNKCFLCFKEHPTKVKAIACEVAHRKEKVRAKCQSYHFAEQLAKATKRRLTSLNIYCRNRTHHGMEVILVRVNWIIWTSCFRRTWSIRASSCLLLWIYVISDLSIFNSMISIPLRVANNINAFLK